MSKQKSLKLMNQRRGVSAIVIVQLFIVMLCFAFLSINCANMQRHHAASQISSDLASRWGVDLLSRETDANVIQSQVTDLAHRNWTVAQNESGWLSRNRRNIDVKVVLGSARPGDDGHFDFFPNQLPLNAVSVDSESFIGTTGFITDNSAQLQIKRKSVAIAIERDLCVVIDRSGSMNFDLRTNNWSTDTRPNNYNPLSLSSSRSRRRIAYQFWWYWADPEFSRWSTMIPALYGLADELDETTQNELFSIVSYSTDFNYNAWDHNGGVSNYSGNSSTIEYQPSFDYDTAVTSFDNKYKFDQPIAGGTNISAGIDKAVEVLTGDSARPNAFKTIILMTDGQWNDGRDPVLSAEDAAELGIEVFTVTFGTGAAQQAMIDTAEAGNGRHFHAPDGDALEDIFREIANIPPAAYIQ